MSSRPEYGDVRASILSLSLAERSTYNYGSPIMFDIGVKEGSDISVNESTGTIRLMKKGTYRMEFITTFTPDSFTNITFSFKNDEEGDIKVLTNFPYYNLSVDAQQLNIVTVVAVGKRLRMVPTITGQGSTYSLEQGTHLVITRIA